ncbi:MAG: hypothetical protein KKE20_07325 [Nanoarchaeota archaeon]|nr:hypothetical protein [Nanoarchaeota archaeon]
MKNGMFAVFIGMLMVFSVLVIADSDDSYDDSYKYSYGVKMGSVRTGPVYEDELEMHYNVRNTGTEDIDDGRVILWIPDLDYYATTRSFDIYKGDSYGYFMNPDMAGFEPGFYLARVKFSSDYARDARWIWLEIS